LLHEDLAEHILLELAARIGGCSDAQHTSDQPDDAFNDRSWMWNLNTWSDEVLKEMTNNVIILMSAAGETYRSCELAQSLPEILKTFLVGTEKRKAWKERRLPKPSELGPISRMKFQSTANTGKIVM
jgi:hypothetical protein